MVIGGEGFQCGRIPLEDSDAENLACLVSTVFDLIKAVREKSGIVLVRCFEGRSKSAAPVVGYITQFRQPPVKQCSLRHGNGSFREELGSPHEVLHKSAMEK